MSFIDYKILNDSIYYYGVKGYERIETPWLVSKGVSEITRPKDTLPYVVIKGNKEKEFVGSGEQSFLYLALKGYINVGKYQTVTPCMRNDDFDELHTKYFMKNELINIVPMDSSEKQCKYELDTMIHAALNYFHKYVYIYNCALDIEKTSDDSYDINILFKDKKIEIGSYGIRQTSFCKWVYGTGLAEPRFSSTINEIRCLK